MLCDGRGGNVSLDKSSHKSSIQTGRDWTVTLFCLEIKILTFKHSLLHKSRRVVNLFQSEDLKNDKKVINLKKKFQINNMLEIFSNCSISIIATFFPKSVS